MQGEIGPQTERRHGTKYVREHYPGSSRVEVHSYSHSHKDETIRGAVVPCSPSCDISLTLLYNMGKKKQKQKTKKKHAKGGER